MLEKLSYLIVNMNLEKGHDSHPDCDHHQNHITSPL